MNILKTLSYNSNVAQLWNSFTQSRPSKISTATATALGALTLFSLAGITSSEKLWPLENCGGLAKNMQLYTCPTLNPTSVVDSRWNRITQILQEPRTQEILTEGTSICPYGSRNYFPPDQHVVLKNLLTDIGYYNFLTNQTLHKELDGFQSKYQNTFLGSTSKGEMVSLATEGMFDLSKLSSEGLGLSESLQSKIRKSYTGVKLAKIGDKDITLVISPDPASDHNGAFSPNKFEKNFLSGLKEVSKLYPVYYMEANSLDQLLKYAKEVKEKIGNIKIMIIEGHGSANTLQLGVDSFIKTSRGMNNVPQNSLPIDPDGTIILHSCSGGEGRENGFNLVNTIAQQHLDIEVVSLDKTTSPRFVVNDLKNRNFSLRDYYTNEDITYKAKFKKIDECFPTPSWCFFKFPRLVNVIENPQKV